MIAFSLTVVAISVLMLIRNELVFRIRMRRLDEVSAKNHTEIVRNDFIEVMERRYAELDQPSYQAMVLDLRRWTYSQFYPSEVA